MQNLRKLRIKLGVKQNSIAEQLGIRQSNFANIELGTLKTSAIEGLRKNVLDLLQQPYMDKIAELKRQIIELERLSDAAVQDAYGTKNQ
jgi:predicted transcriptional regulator